MDNIATVLLVDSVIAKRPTLFANKAIYLSKTEIASSCQCSLMILSLNGRGFSLPCIEWYRDEGDGVSYPQSTNNNQ